MIQVNENLTVLQPGDQYQEIYANYLKIYLSGSMDVGGGDKLPWQQKFINGLEKMTAANTPGVPDYSRFKFLLFNPLSPANGEPSLDNPEFLQKMEWEQGMMQQADVIFCNLLKKGVSALSIEPFLLWAQSGKVVCRCPVESMFYPRVKVLSDTYQIPLLGNADSLIQVMDMMFQRIPKFNELLNYNL